MKQICMFITAMMLCLWGYTTTFATASIAPPDTTIKQWLLSDNGKIRAVTPLTLPNIALQGPTAKQMLGELSLEMSIQDVVPYFQSFLNRTPIAELILYGVNKDEKPVIKITLRQVIITKFNVNSIVYGANGEGVRGVFSIIASALSTQKLVPTGGTAGAITLKDWNRYNKAIVYVNGVEHSFTGYQEALHGKIMVDAGGLTTVKSSFDPIEVLLKYDDVAGFPDWLSSFDSKTTINGNTPKSIKIKYELSSPTTKEKILLELDYLITSEEFLVNISNSNVSSGLTAKGIEGYDEGVVFEKYTGTVTNVQLTSSLAAASTASTGTGTVTTKKAISSGNWAGSWDTSLGELSLSQSGKKVTGTYGDELVKIDGTLFGNKLTGTWHDEEDEGTFSITLSEDRQSFDGYLYDPAGDQKEYEWSGDRE